MLSRGVCLLQDKARPHSAHITTALLGNFKLDVLHPPPYSPDLAPSHFHLFLHLKKHLAGKKVDDDDEVQEKVVTWFKGQAADFYDSGKRNLVQDLINVWTMPATVLKNKVMYRQFIDSVAFVNYKLCICLRPLCLYFLDMLRMFKKSLWPLIQTNQKSCF